MSIRKSSKWLHMTLWGVQVLLSVTLIWAAYMKLFQTPEVLSAMWPWTGQVPPLLVKCTGGVDLLAGLGLVLPTLLNVRPALTFLAAAGVVLLMVCSIIFHLSRGESALFNMIFAAFAAFVAWGRQSPTTSLC